VNLIFILVIFIADL